VDAVDRLLAIGLQTCGRHPDSPQSCPGRDLAQRDLAPGSLSAGESPSVHEPVTNQPTKT